METPSDLPGHEQCGGTKRNGQPCTQRAGYGTEHVGIGKCKFHGGCTPNHQKAAETELAKRAVRTYGLDQEVDPWTALLDEIARTNGHVMWLRDQIADLEPSELISGTLSIEEKTGGGPTGDYTAVTTGAGEHVFLRLYREERKHLAMVCKTAIGCGIAERHVKLAEQQGAAMVKLIELLITDPELGLSQERQRVARKRAGHHLSLLASA